MDLDMRRVGLGLSGALFVGGLAAACGETTQRPTPQFVAGQPFERSVGGAGAQAVEEPGGASPTAGGAGASGGARALDGMGSVGWAGEGGAPLKATRPITAIVSDLTPQPLQGVKLIIDGQSFVSDANGIVQAEAPLGAYDVLVDDTDASEYGSGYELYEGVTIDHLVLALPRDYLDQDPPEGAGAGSITGTFPNDATGLVGFASTSGDLSAGTAVPLNNAYKLRGIWYLGTPAAGDLVALLWTLDARQHPNAYWFGSTPWRWDPAKPFTQDIAVAPLSPAATHDVSFKITSPEGAQVSAQLRLGPLKILSDVAQGEPITLPKSQVISTGSVDPALIVNLAKSSDTWAPRVYVDAPVTNEAATLLVDLPAFVEPLSPAENATKVRATSQFAVTEVPNSCKRFQFLINRYQVRVNTTRSELTPPDLGVVGVSWPRAKQGLFSAQVRTPCPSTDWLLSGGKTDPAAQKALYTAPPRDFSTAK